jgi:decaprenylphospho-beta-D-ribofuranose 2-oxidase
MSAPLPPERIASLSGFGMHSSADGYVYRPTNPDEIASLFRMARETGRKVLLRGAGRSYGDANIAPEALVIDIGRMRRILAWDAQTGIVDAEAGATIEDLWRLTLEDGYWPPVVSGTMYPTLAGALAMNIHGKNAFKAGTFGEHVLEIEIMLPSGERRTLARDDPLFPSIVSSAGLLAVIMRVKLQMKNVHSGNLRVLSLSCGSLAEQISTLLHYEPEADYMVGWVDCFGHGANVGRGQIHIAWYDGQTDDFSQSLLASHQDLPDTILGFWPKSTVWKVLRLFNNRGGMRFINWARHTAALKMSDGKIHGQSLVGFSFLLDYVPNWRNAYLPGGFIQYQSFVPKDLALEVFSRQIRMQQEAGQESFLGVLKRHKADSLPFLFSHAVDGFSLALDFKVTEGNWQRLEDLCHRMNDVVLQAGGKFYFAKDSTLRKADVESFLPPDMLERFQTLKKELDPEQLLTSSLAQRVGLIP